MAEEISEIELERKKIDIQKVVQDSDNLMDNFEVYIGVYESESRHQTSHITKEEFDKMQNHKYIGSKHENSFFNNLPLKDSYVDVRTLVLTKDNYALAFHPMIWHVLKIEERLAACRIAWKEIYKNDVKEFCNHNSKALSMVGENYQGSLNIGSFFRDDLIGPDYLIDICNASNKIKDSYYINKMMSGKKYDKITDFSSFEELQYLSPLEPKEEDNNKIGGEAKAYYFDQIYRRRLREATQKGLDLITLHDEDLQGFFPEFDKYVADEQKRITDTNLFVMLTLGSPAIERDKKYLKLKTLMFDLPRAEEHNKLYQEYAKLKKEKVDIINKPLQDKLDKLEKQQQNIEQQKKDAFDAIELYGLEQQENKLKNQIVGIKNKMARNHNKVLKPIVDAVEKVDSQKVTFEQALEHFKDHFEKKENTKNISSTKKML